MHMVLYLERPRRSVSRQFLLPMHLSVSSLNCSHGMKARIAMRNASIRMKSYHAKTHKSVESKKGDWVLLNAKTLRFKVGCPKLLP